MLKFSKRFEYALIVMVDLTERESDAPITARSLAERYHIPNEILGKVMQALKKKGLLNSVQGVKGGYCLKENDPGRISLYSILSAIDGPVGLVYCLCEEERDRACNRHDNCNIQTMMVGIQQELINYLKKMFLSDVKKPKI